MADRLISILLKILLVLEALAMLGIYVYIGVFEPSECQLPFYVVHAQMIIRS